jgi:hypothetical protein
MASPRELVESPVEQGVDESITWTVDVSNVGSSPTSPSVDVFATDDLATSVKSTVMPSGTPSVSGDVITLPELTALTAGTNYRVEVKFTVGGGAPFEVYFIVKALR